MVLMEKAAQAAQTVSPYFWNYANDRPIWNLIDYLSYARHGFNRNSVVYAAIMYKVRAIASTRLRVYTGTPDQAELTIDHPLNTLFLRPNPQQSWPEFEGLNTTYLNLAGNAFIWLDNEQGTIRPRAMYPLRPDRVRLVPDARGIKGFLYVPPGKSEQDTVPFLPEEVIHIKLPNPDDPFEGMGYGQAPMASSGQTIDVDNHLTAFLKLYIERGAMPAGLLKYSISLDDGKIKDIRRRWTERYGGVSNWANIGILDQSGDYKPLGHSLKDMNFADLDDRNEIRTLMPLGVPGILLNTRSGMKNSTYSNVQEAREAFWDDTMRYEMNLFDEEYSHFLNEKGVFIERDLSQVPALQKRILAQSQAARSMWDMGMPANQAFRMVGLRSANTPTGNISYIGGQPKTDEDGELLTTQPALPAPQKKPTAQTDEPDGDEEQTDEEQADEADKAAGRLALERSGRPTHSKAWTEEKKSLLWKAADDLARSHEDDFGEAAAAAFESDKRGVLAILEDNAKESHQAKATIDWLKPAKKINDYLSNSAKTTWRKGFTPRMSALVNDVGQMWAVELGHQWNIRNFAAEAWFADYTLVFAQPISVTSSTSIQTLLAQAQAEGWSTYQMQERMGLLFQQWADGDLSASDFAWMTDRMPPYRREMIARTESTRMQGAGTQQLFKEWEVEKKEWLATPDKRCRPTHVAANGQIVGIDEPFKVGGFDMMYPGDMSMGAPVKEAVLCRCTEIPVLD